MLQRGRTAGPLITEHWEDQLIRVLQQSMLPFTKTRT